ncbi:MULTISPECIES: DUF502 domain-containing protein [unclassified Saccharicrinis]|uniref:DUF502 domain-containing protein n=1 Tax=unclassified Saccharicrinis TaxID=2646859 RepID=UPI003D342E81
MKALINYFLQGLLFIAPIGITVYIVYVIFKLVDDILQQWLKESLDINIPGLGVVIIVALLVFIGFVGQTFIGRPFKYLFGKLIKKAPLVKVIYSAFNDLFSAFVGKEKKFNKPVLVKVNMLSDLEKLGFLTEEDLSLIDEKDKVAVYFPHSYNFSGEMFIVPKAQVRPIDISPAEVMKFIVSAGVAGWN